MSYSPHACAAHAAVVRHMRARPWLWQGRALLWPHPVAMHVSWAVIRAAHPGSKIFGQSVRPRSPWQHMLVASVHRGEMFPGMTQPMQDWRQDCPSSYYLLKYMLKFY